VRGHGGILVGSESADDGNRDRLLIGACGADALAEVGVVGGEHRDHPVPGLIILHTAGDDNLGVGDPVAGQADPLVGEDAGHRGLGIHHLVEVLDLVDAGGVSDLVLVLGSVDLPCGETDEAGDEHQDEEQGPQPFGGQSQAEQFRPPSQSGRARR
jgi:hypothetical protein